ncbi:MAG: flagellar motor protein MotB [Alphaproteobacteria bacterium]|nr:flagellar motor protein MotB [Alphaproteobacteria bacterium]MCB9975464.1 flagellar motor protein MotB [Rhodospirillales bacterium]
MAEAAKKENEQPIIVKKIVQGGGHHGGAWKVAYADFVTAMMAFFLLLWLLNVATDEQKNAISNYFDPTHPKVSQDTSGAGGVMGGLTMSPQGAMASTQNPLTPMQVNKERLRGTDSQSKVNLKKSAKEIAREKEEKKRFKEAEQKLKQAIQKNPELAKLAKNLIIDMTPEGLRIQIVDQEGEPMFPSGSAKMFPKTEALLKQITEVILGMPNELSVRGHTDSVKFGAGASYTNWELSADRANASRRVILDTGMPADRLNNVMGKADTEPLIAEDPSDARNRRITIILLKEELTNPLPPEEDEGEDGAEGTVDGEGGAGAEDENPFGEGFNEDGTEDTGEPGERPPMRPIGTFRKTPGAVDFP